MKGVWNEEVGRVSCVCKPEALWWTTTAATSSSSSSSFATQLINRALFNNRNTRPDYSRNEGRESMESPNTAAAAATAAKEKAKAKMAPQTKIEDWSK